MRAHQKICQMTAKTEKIALLTLTGIQFLNESWLSGMETSIPGNRPIRKSYIPFKILPPSKK